MFKRYYVRLSVLALAILITAVLGQALSTGQLTREMLKDFGYYRWAHGDGQFKGRFLEAFERDYHLRLRFIGQPIESLCPLFPTLHNGATYGSNSYRATNVSSFFDRYPGQQHADYWLGGTEADFGYCVLVVDGKIRDFFHVKG